jgi:nicotinamidase-related amidase
MRVEPSHATLLVVDIQERLFPHIYEHEALQANCIRLIKGMRILNIPIIVTEQYSKGLGKTIAPVAAALGSFEPYEKMTFSACRVTEVESIVLGTQGHQIIVLGIEAHVCIQQTVLDILAQGRAVIVVEDCISSRKRIDRDVAIARMRSEGALITTYESLLFELLGTADAEAFKQISSLVK